MAEQQPDPEIDAIVARINAVHGRHILTDAEERIRAGVTGLREAAAALYAVPLTNADEPGTLFRVYRGEE